MWTVLLKNNRVLYIEDDYFDEFLKKHDTEIVEATNSHYKERRCDK